MSMNREQFLAMMNEEFEGLVELNKSKGRDYAGDEDVLSNFKAHAEALDLTPEQIWAVYAGKHWDAIQSYCRRGQVESEPIEGRIRDLLVYGFLLLGMVREGAVPAVPNPLCVCGHRFAVHLHLPRGDKPCGNCGCRQFTPEVVAYGQ